MRESVFSGHDARFVANLLIEKGLGKQAFTPLQVIKLVYLCHGWMLGLYGRPMSAQPVEAWQYGPVIPDVYHELKGFGRQAIKRTLNNSRPKLDELEADLVDQVVAEYGKYSGIELSSLTHQNGTPWHEIWTEFGRNTIIPNSLIQKHFAEMASAE